MTILGKVFVKLLERIESIPYTPVHVREQTQATKALLKFCEDHRMQVDNVDTLRSCLAALEREDIRAAMQEFQKIPLGGMGCFNDWLPPAICENETPEYAVAVFDALIVRWNLLMRLSLPKEKS